MKRRQALFVCVFSAVMFGCGGHMQDRPTTRISLPKGSIVLLSAKPDAEVYIDERYVCTVAELRDRRLTLKPGQYRLEVKAPGHYPWRGDVSVTPSEKRVNVEMLPMPIH